MFCFHLHCTFFFYVIVEIINIFLINLFTTELYYKEMFECDVLDMKDDYDFKDENKQNEKKKSKFDVSCDFKN